MEKNNLLKLFEKKLFTVHKSHNESLDFLSKEELTGLCKHNNFLEKVHAELKPEISHTNLDVFDSNLEVFRNSGAKFSELYIFVHKEKTFISQNSIENLFLKKKVTSSSDFNPVFTKLAEKSANPWFEINKCLYEDPNFLRIESVKQLFEGIALKKITLYSRLVDAVECFAHYVNDIWACSDFTHIFNLCKTNEKFVFILLYPYLFKPLGKLVWPTLLTHFHFVSGSFTCFMQKVSITLKRGTAFGHIYKTLSVKTSVKVAIGASSVGLFALFSNYFTEKTNKVLIKNVKIYRGLGGTLGSGIALLRLEGSKVIYEVAKTLSTWSNAAFAGAIEPKQEVISKVLESPAIEDIINSITKSNPKTGI